MSKEVIRVITRSEVDEQFPTVDYSAWWTSRNKYKAEQKEIGKRDPTALDYDRDEDDRPVDRPPSPPETEGQHGSGNTPDKSNLYEAGRKTASCDSDDLHSLCAICMDCFQKGDIVRPLSCGHIFHPFCVDPWLTEQNACCPLCKKAFFFYQNPLIETRAIGFTAILPAAPGTVLLRDGVVPRAQ